MTGRPLVSVVTPAFNSAEFIRDAIQSILDQEYPNLELIVMDGGSTDGTLDILKSFAGRLTWHSGPDVGQSDALNKGFAQAKGDYLTWLNADDILYPGAIAHSIGVFETQPKAGLVYGQINLLNRDGSLWRRDRNVRQGTYEELLQWDNFVSQPGTIFARKAWEACGPLSVADRYAMDWDLWLKIAAKFPVIYTPRVLAALRIYPETKTASGGLERFEEIRVMLERNGSRASHLYYKIGRWHYEHNQLAEARRYLAEALRRQPRPAVRRSAIAMITKSLFGGALLDLGRGLRARARGRS